MDGRMDGDLYIQVLEDELMLSTGHQDKTPSQVTFQQDNDPKHTSRLAKEWLGDQQFAVMEWPSSSPDMNPIEHVWAMLDRRVHSRNRLPRNVEELWVALQEEWEALDIGFIRGLYESMPRRVRALDDAKGSYTKY